MKYLQKQIQIYREAQQNLKSDSDRFEVEQVILLGISFFNLLIDVESSWIRSVFRRDYEYDPLINESYSYFLSQWNLITSQLLVHANRFDRLSYLEEIKKLVKNQDISYEMPDELVALRDEAFDAHARGETIPMDDVIDGCDESLHMF